MTAAMRTAHLVVVGPMASGKSTVGRALAERLGRPLRDSDDDLVVELGMSGRELAERDGVVTLHHWEAAHLLGALAHAVPAVVTAAASTVDDARCRRALSEHVVVSLVVPPSVLADRLHRPGMAGDHRRLLGPDDVDLMARRAAAFREVADAEVGLDAGDRSPAELADAVLARLAPGRLLPGST